MTPAVREPASEVRRSEQDDTDWIDGLCQRLVHAASIRVPIVSIDAYSVNRQTPPTAGPRSDQDEGPPSRSRETSRLFEGEA